jgi:amino acid transporter
MKSPVKKHMSVFTLSLMTVAAVVTSLRGLPMMAKEGLSMIFYILFAVIMFLLPASLVAAELGGAFSEKGGGIYTWVKEAFGSKWGFTAIWLQWIQNVVWYPTTLAFAAGALA